MESSIIYIVIVIFIIIQISKYLFKNPVNLLKVSPYECGFSPTGSTRQRFDVSFYLIAILFIIFDLEIVLLLPYASIILKLKELGLAICWLFIMILTLGYIFELKKALT